MDICTNINYFLGNVVGMAKVPIFWVSISFLPNFIYSILFPIITLLTIGRKRTSEFVSASVTKFNESCTMTESSSAFSIVLGLPLFSLWGKGDLIQKQEMVSDPIRSLRHTAWVVFQSESHYVRTQSYLLQYTLYIFHRGACGTICYIDGLVRNITGSSPDFYPILLYSSFTPRRRLLF